jgi:DNA transposition AAA+ family ATPase
MKSVFVHNDNVSKFCDICEELESPESMIGPSLAIVSGRAGLGKSESAKFFATQNSSVYVPPLNTRTPAMILREICFELCKARPFRTDDCLILIATEMAKQRRLVVIDEADLLGLHVLECLRNVSEMYSFPILFIGEGHQLDSKIASRRRLSSRIRRRLEFGLITQADILQYLRRALDVKVSPEVCSFIHRFCEGNWRPLLVLAAGIEKALKASGANEISMNLMKQITA